MIASLMATSTTSSISQDLKRLNQEHKHHSEEQAVFNAYQSIIDDQKADAKKVLAETEEIYKIKISTLRSEFEFKLKSVQDELEKHLSRKAHVSSQCSLSYARQ